MDVAELEGTSAETEATYEKVKKYVAEHHDGIKPKTGIVRLRRLTEKQYKNIYIVTGEPDYQEKTVGVKKKYFL